MGKTIGSFKGKSIQFIATHLVEFFSAPLPDELEGGGKISSEADLFRSGCQLGFGELFLTDDKDVVGVCEGQKYRFSIEDFLRWQLELLDEDTLWQVIGKTDAPVSEILDRNVEIEKNPDYYPDDWLNFYYRNEYPGKGLALVKRMRQEAPDKFYGTLIESILDENVGLLNTDWYETEIDGNLDEVRASYAEWDVPLMIVSTGKFLPYSSEENRFSSLCMDEYNVKHMHVRNYDEGDML